MSIFEAAQSGDLKQIQLFLETDPQSLYQVDELGRNLIMFATLSGNLELVKYLYAQGADINWLSPQIGCSVLGFAVLLNQQEIVAYLLEQGVDVDKYSSSEEWPLSRLSQSPLSEACKNGHKEIVEMLLKYSAKLSKGDLVNAVESGNIDLVRLLLDSQKISANDMNPKNTFEKSALGMALFKGDTEITNLLLAHGALVDVPETNIFFNEGPISSAIYQLDWITVKSLIHYGAKLSDHDIWSLARYNQWELLELALNKECLFTAENLLSLTLHALDTHLTERWLQMYTWSEPQLAAGLVEACQCKRLDIVQLIWSMTQKFSVEIQKKSVLAVCESGSIELLQWLLNTAKFPLDLESHLNESDYLPLHIAIRSSQYEIVKILLDLGATCTLSQDLVSPVVLACKANAFEIASLLIQHGADLHGQNQLGGSFYVSPLHALCAYQGSATGIKFLISQGTHLDARDERERRPLELAFEYGDKERIMALIEAGSKIPSPTDQEYQIFFSALTDCWEAQIMKFIIEKTEHKLFLNHYGYTPFLLAAMNGDHTQFKSLLNVGEDIEQTNQWGQTALLLAAAAGHKDILEDLLVHKVNLDHLDQFDFGAITWAGAEGDQFEIVQILLQAGASPNLYDENGSALTKLAARGAWKSVKCLLDFGSNPRVESEWENSVMIEACLQGQLEIVQLLLQTPNQHPMYSYHPRHPVEAALMNNHWEIVDLLLQHEIWPFTNYKLDPLIDPVEWQNGKKNMKVSDLEFKHQLSNALEKAVQEKQSFWITKWNKLFNDLKQHQKA